MRIVALLLTFIVIHLFFNFNSLKMFSYYKQHFADSSIPQYSLSAVETDTQRYNFEHKKEGIFPIITRKPEVDRLVSLSPP